MKKLPLLIVGLGLLSLTQCVGPGPGPDYGPRYGDPFWDGPFYGGPYYGYGGTGWLASHALWTGVRAYGIHERHKFRHDRVDRAVNNFHKPAPGGGHGGGPPSGGHGGGGHGGGGHGGGGHSGGHGGGGHGGGGGRR